MYIRLNKSNISKPFSCFLVVYWKPSIFNQEWVDKVVSLIFILFGLMQGFAVSCEQKHNAEEIWCGVKNAMRAPKMTRSWTSFPNTKKPFYSTDQYSSTFDRNSLLMAIRSIMCLLLGDISTWVGHYVVKCPQVLWTFMK